MLVVETRITLLFLSQYFLCGIVLTGSGRQRDSHVNPKKYEIGDVTPTTEEIEVTYGGGNTNEEELMWV